MRLSESDSAEHVPWVRAGFVVVAYSLDGGGQDESSLDEFRAAQGGVANARDALAYTRTHLRQVDPNRILLVGHSSAAEAALLAAAHLDVRGAVVFNAAGEGCWFQPEPVRVAVAWSSPGFVDFCQETRAANHLAHLTVPVFLFGSPDDQVVPLAAVAGLRDALARADVDVTWQVGSGDHYTSMITQGVPAAISWATALVGPTPAGP